MFLRVFPACSTFNSGLSFNGLPKLASHESQGLGHVSEESWESHLKPLLLRPSEDRKIYYSSVSVQGVIASFKLTPWTITSKLEHVQ